MQSAWEVTSYELTPAGRRYTVVLGEREYKVLHTLSGGWRFWDGRFLCEANGSIRASVLAYERENNYGSS